MLRPRHAVVIEERVAQEALDSPPSQPTDLGPDVFSVLELSEEDPPALPLPSVPAAPVQSCSNRRDVISSSVDAGILLFFWKYYSFSLILGSDLSEDPFVTRTL